MSSESIRQQFVKEFGDPDTPEYLADCIIKKIQARIGEKNLLGFSWDVLPTAAIPIKNYTPNKVNVSYYGGWYGTIYIRLDNSGWKSSAQDIQRSIEKVFASSLVYTSDPVIGNGLMSTWGRIANYCIKNRLETPAILTWDSYFLECDWPLLKHWKKQMHLINALKSDNNTPHGISVVSSHKYSWTDLNTLENDNNILKNFREFA